MTGDRRAESKAPFMRGRKVLLVNPWIYDFAAYDPVGKTSGIADLGSLLKRTAAGWIT
jgi:hypothetical protein